MNFKTKKKLPRVIAFVCAGVALLGVVCGVAIFKNKADDNRTVINPTFAVGALDENGKYVEDKASIFTKDSFECEGLQVKLDFDSSVTYQAFFYNYLDNCVQVSEVYETSAKFDVPYSATHARLVVTPKWSEDVAEEDRVCHWYDLNKYSSQLEISINKATENETSVNLMDLVNLTLDDNGNYVVAEEDMINIRGEEYTHIMVLSPSVDGQITIYFYDESGAKLNGSAGHPMAGPGSYLYEIPEEAYFITFSINIPEDEINDFEVYLRRM